MLNTWDAAIVERFDAMRSSPSVERITCSLTFTGESLDYLDRTLNQVRRRSRHRGAERVASGAELTTLRSAAIEVAAGAYTHGVRERQRHRIVPGADATRAARPGDLAGRIEERRRARVETVLCALSPALVADLDDVLVEALRVDVGVLHTSRGRELGLDEARSVIVESAVVAWLILRGYSAGVPGRRQSRGWLEAVRQLARGRRST